MKLPVKIGGTRLRSAYRQGVPTMPASECRADYCDHFQDEHALHCRDNRGMKVGRYDRIRDKIYMEGQRASLSPKKEMSCQVLSLALSPDQPTFKLGRRSQRKISFDVSVVSPVK